MPAILICTCKLHAAEGSVVSARGGRGGDSGEVGPNAVSSPDERIHALFAAGGLRGEVSPQPLLTGVHAQGAAGRGWEPGEGRGGEEVLEECADDEALD